MMKFIITCMFGLFFVGLFTGHTGAAFIAFCAASFFMWADGAMDDAYMESEADLADIVDDDIDPRIKS